METTKHAKQLFQCAANWIRKLILKKEIDLKIIRSIEFDSAIQ